MESSAVGCTSLSHHCFVTDSCPIVLHTLEAIVGVEGIVRDHLMFVTKCMKWQMCIYVWVGR